MRFMKGKRKKLLTTGKKTWSVILSSVDSSFFLLRFFRVAGCPGWLHELFLRGDPWNVSPLADSCTHPAFVYDQWRPNYRGTLHAQPCSQPHDRHAIIKKNN
jgi:hypothetical protein